MRRHETLRHTITSRKKTILARTNRTSSPSTGSDLPPLRKRVFFFITLAFPVFLLILLESSLRLFNYGPNLDLFTTEQVGDKTYHVMNQGIKGRYFSTVAFSPNISPDYFLVPKPTGTYRIFCLGGSTTIGFPYGPVGSFSSFLRDRLRVIFPNKSIEIINLGMTATNSYTVADILCEVVNFQPDLIIVYDGHNEFYGALGVASLESAGGFRFLTRLHLQFVHLRTYQLLQSALSGMAGLFRPTKETTEGGTMMERLAQGQYVPLRGPTYQKGLQIFRANVNEIRNVCRKRNIPLILSSQVSNLRDLPPFVSSPGPDVSLSNLEAYQELWIKGQRTWKSGQLDSALRSFQTAVQLDSNRADVHYWTAACLDSLGDRDRARTEYVAARDFDQLRFRCSSDFNDEIEKTCDGRTVFFAPIEQVFSMNSKDGIVGSNLILEHLHPRLEGNFLIGKEYARIMRDHELLATREEWTAADTIEDGPLWNRRPLTEVDELAAQIRTIRLTSNWPFAPAESSHSIVAEDQTPLYRIALNLVNGNATWEETHVAAAEYFDRTGDPARSRKEYQCLMNQLPYNVSAYLILGQMLNREGNLTAAEDVLARSLAVEPTYHGNRLLGEVQIRLNRSEYALEYLRQAYALSQTPDQRTSAGYILAVTMIRTGHSGEAVAVLQNILRINPTLKDARALLDTITGKSG
jgi:tetratricopeptide (TPR) repeat protein